MTDGERLVWATSYALAFDRGSDPVVAARTAAHAIEVLREVAVRPASGLQIEERDLLDEIVSVP